MLKYFVKNVCNSEKITTFATDFAQEIEKMTNF